MKNVHTRVEQLYIQRFIAARFEISPRSIVCPTDFCVAQVARRLGDGDERVGSSRGSPKRRVPARLRNGGLVQQHPDGRPILQLPQPQLRPPLRAEQGPVGPVLPRRLAQEQSRVLGRVPILDRRGSLQPQRRLFRYDDPGDPMDPESPHDNGVEEFRAVEGEVRGGRAARLLGTPHLQAHLERGPRGDHQSSDMRPLPQQLSVGERSDR